MKPVLNLKGVSFQYLKNAIIEDISFQVNGGEIACLLGPSGCGKSTLLRLIAGFEQPQQGQIYIHQNLVASADTMTPPQQRQVGMLFQNLALFPHMTVNQNIGFGLSGHADKQQRIDELLCLCRLEGLNHRYPHQLSGGQRQRVALARAMAPKPRIILLDEPFSSVESELQNDLAHEVKQILKSQGVSVLWVTHSIDEALAVADHIGIIWQGRLMEWSTPTELYEQPKSAVAVKFLNQANLISGEMNEQGCVNSTIGCLNLVNEDQLTPHQATQVAIKQSQLSLSLEQPTNGVVKSCVYQGGYYALTIDIGDKQRLKMHHNQALKPNTAIQVKAITNNGLYGYQT
ncbi:MAG: ABC transporter ATP-binding protein [Proteobacteria bacterium]|nr:MAG: ABC transporter ATP-binding protein [Pseudomonadota bacterium]